MASQYAKTKYYERRKLLDVIGRISQTRYCQYVPMASRAFTPLEYHSNVSSLSFDGEDGYDEQGTTNSEIVAKHLGIGTFMYVLSSSHSNQRMYRSTIEELE